jgi:hypothetical protein
MMVKNLKRVLYLLMLLSGGVLAVQCILLLSKVEPITLIGIGTISQGTVSGLFIEVILICVILVLFGLLTFRPGLAADPSKKLSPLLVLLIAGSICCIEGIASINLSTSIVTGIDKTITILIGIQLFCLGIISISSYVAAKGRSYFIKNVPNYCVLLFFILLIPAAFLLGA